MTTFICLFDQNTVDDGVVVYARLDLIDQISHDPRCSEDEAWSAFFKGCWYSLTEEEARRALGHAGA